MFSCRFTEVNFTLIAYSFLMIDYVHQIFQHWKSFGESCLNAKCIFSLQTKDAYKFLETSPSSLSLEEWKKQYDAVIVDLNKINLDPFTPKEPAPITA